MGDIPTGDMATWAGVLISAVLAVIALLVSIVAQRKANTAQQRIVEIEEQREQARQIESTQAKLRPELRQNGQDSWLCLVNIGAAEARNIRINMDGKPLAEHPAAISNNLMPDLVGAESEISCLLLLDDSCTPPFQLKIIWDDASGRDRIYRSTLTW